MLDECSRRVEAIIFDLDGVLIDSEPLMRFAFERCYRQYIGDGPVPIEDYLEHMGESFPRIMDHLGLPHTLWQPYRELCQQHIEKIRVFPEGRDLLEWATDQQLKLAILTGKDRQRTQHLLEFFGLDHFFELVIASDELTQPKPDPEGMVRALEILQCEPEAALMIGDAVSDVECAQRAGVRAIAVTWGIKPERVQSLCQPEYVVHTWDELTALLRDLTQIGDDLTLETIAGRGRSNR